MKLRCLAFLAVVAVAPAWGHPHEWVDWGVGLVVETQKPVRVVEGRVELTWDEWFSALVLTDYPTLGKAPLSASDLATLDTTYGLADPDRAVNFSVLYQGHAIKVKLTIQQPKSDGKQITLVYSFPLGLKVLAPSELRVELYDPTYYADMGIRAKAGGYFVSSTGSPVEAGTFQFQQDVRHPYYGGSVLPEVVAFALRP